MRKIAMFFLFFVGCFCAVIKESPAKNNLGEKSILLECSTTGCKYPRPGRENNASHIAFTTQKGKSLLFEIKSLRTVVRAKNELQTRKFELKDQEIGLFKVQLVQAEKTATAQGKRIADLTQENRRITGENNRLVGEVAKYRGERYKFMIIGLCIGAGVVLAGGIAVGVFIALR